MNLAQVERRLAALHQAKTFRPTDPWWVLFSEKELDVIFKTTEVTS